MNKKLTLTLLIIIILVLSGCSGMTFNGFKSSYKDPATVNYFVGTEGLSLEFLDQAPPDTVFEGSEFDVQTIIHNKGAYDVINQENVQVEIVTDSANTIQLVTQGLEDFYLNDLGYVQLHGKSYFYPEGEQDFFALNRYRARDIIGNFERNSINFYVTMCYPYRTYFSDEICIDTNANKMDVRTQVCTSENKDYSKGQGAPVEITAVESNMVPKGAYIEPQFVIHIAHSENGIVSFYNSSNHAQNTCDDIGSEQVNKMELTAILGNNSLECFPNPVFFRDGEAKVECRLQGSRVLATAANYYTNLNIELKYLYTQTFDRKISVRRTDSSAYTGVEGFDYGECAPWDKWDESTEQCMSKCTYCAQIQNANDPYCIVSDKDSFSGNQKVIGGHYGCVYTKAECIEAGSKCIQDDSKFCLPGMYCGEPECAYNPKKNDKPSVNLEIGVPEGRIMWYCEDEDNTLDLVNSCGCLTESYYAILPNGKLGCDSPNLNYTKVTGGKNNPSTMRTYYQLDTDLPAFSVNPEAICLRVIDVQGAETTRKAFFDCLDQDICFK